MNSNTLLVLLLVAALALAAWSVLRARHSRAISIHSSIEHVREVGHLSAFKVATKEIVTETKHDWGDAGERYFSWILSSKKMVMIFEFQVDFRYDLRSPDFRIEALGREVAIRCPPCTCEVLLKNIQFYDEQRGRLLPWLLPDLMNGYFSSGFSPQDKNELIAAAKRQAEAQARTVIQAFTPAAETSAATTLRALCRSLGATSVTIEFDHGREAPVTVAYQTAAA